MFIGLLCPFVLLSLSDVTMIDFGQYESRIQSDYGALKDTGEPHYNDGSPPFVPEPSIMFISNWIIDLRSSGSRISNIVKGQCVAVESKENNQTVMGVRINFPKTRQNDRAIIRPQFPFHAYDRQGNFTNLSNGVAANVGVIKDVSVWVKGRNYPYDFAARFVDNQNKTQEFFFGNLLFDNWRKLTWINPNYIESIRHRVIERKPMYPKDLPYYIFSSFVVYRDMAQIGGDFIFYVKDVSMSYDLHAATIIDPDINDEAVWRIIQERSLKTMEREHREYGERMYDLETQQKLMQQLKGSE